MAKRPTIGEELKEKLEGIDQLIDEALLEKFNGADSPSPGEGLESLKITGDESRYLLLEVKLEYGGNEYTQLYLRGFEKYNMAHVGIALVFMREVEQIAQGHLSFPNGWPKNEHRKPEKSMTVKRRGVKLTITGLGGGLYKLKDKAVEVYGISFGGFGPVPRGYQQQVRDMLGQLVQREQYKGFRVGKVEFDMPEAPSGFGFGSF